MKETITTILSALGGCSLILLLSFVAVGLKAAIDMIISPGADD